MLVGGIVEPGAGAPGGVVAFVAVNLGVEGSRLFKVNGSPGSPVVQELPSATTVNLATFREALETELALSIAAIEELGGTGAIAQPSADWVCEQVRQHLAASGVSLD
jgi:hypothetical protein